MRLFEFAMTRKCLNNYRLHYNISIVWTIFQTVVSIRFYRNTSVASTFWTPVAPLGKPKRGWTAFLCFYTPIAPLGLLFATHEDFFCELRPAQNTQKNQKMLEHSTSTKINCPNFSNIYTAEETYLQVNYGIF